MYVKFNTNIIQISLFNLKILAKQLFPIPVTLCTGAQRYYFTHVNYNGYIAN